MQNFFEQFAWAAERHAGRTAIEVQHKDHLDSFTYARLREMAERTAAWLAVIGIGPGERCAILADNDAHWCAAYLGVLRRGAIAVPLDTAYKASQVDTLLRDSGARVFFTTPKYLETVRAGRAAAGSECRIVLLHGQADGTVSFEGMIGGHMPAPPLPACPSRLDDPAVILYTSGTTSDPKGVVLTHGNLLAERAGAFDVVRRGRARHHPRRAAAVPRAGADGQPAAALFDRRAGGVSRDGEHHRAAACAGRAQGHDLRLRPAVLLSDPPAGHDPGGQVQPRRAVALCGDAGRQRRHARCGPEPGPGAVPPSPRRAGRPHARDGDRRVALRSGHRRRPVPARVQHPARLRSHRDLRRRHLDAAKRPGARDRRSAAARQPGAHRAARGRRRCRKRRRRRSPHPRPDRHAGLLQSPRRDRGGPARRVAAHGRPRAAGRRGPVVDHRPQEGADRPQLRQEHLPGRD